jgi:hypothetical protein
MNPARHLNPRRDLVILVIYLLLAILLTYPLITHFDSFGPGHGVDDPAQTWSLWWLKYSTLNLGISPLYTDYLFYPLGMNLVAYTSTFLNGVISIPLQLVFGVIVAQNLSVLCAFTLGAYGTYLFVSEILSRLDGSLDSNHRVAAALAGAVYGFGAWHLNYAVAGHFMLLSNEWIPFFALYLIRWDRPTLRAGALAGLFFVMATWTELTFAPFLAMLAVMYGVYQIVLHRRGLARIYRRGAEDAGREKKPGAPRVSAVSSDLVLQKPSDLIRARLHPVLLNLVVMGIVGAVGISPLVFDLLADIQRYGYYLTAGVGRIQVFSAEPISFFFPSSQHPLLGAWASSLTNANTSYAFIGYAVLILAALGFYVRRASPTARFWAVAALFFALIMLGPTLIIGGQPTGIPLPFALLRAIPFVNANRYPVRFNVMLMLALTPLVAFGAARLLQPRRVPHRVALGALSALLVFEQLVLPIPMSDLRVPPVYQTIRNDPGDFTVLELPLGWRGSVEMQGRLEDRAQFFQTVHQKRLLGGITSRTPQFKTQYFLEAPVINSLIALETGRAIDATRLAQDRTAAPEVLRFFNIRYIDIDRALAGAAVAQYARDVFPMKEIYRDDTRTVYRVDALPPLDQIQLADETARLYFDDGWGRAQIDAHGAGYRWAARGDSLLWLPLKNQTQTITLRLRGARDKQGLIVRANGQFIAELELSSTWQDYTLRVPASLVRDGLNDFVFTTETAPLNASRASFDSAQDDYTIGGTGVVSPVDIAATGAGYDAGRFGEIFVAGKNVIDAKRGYHLVAVNPQSGAVDRVAAFDTFADANESARLAQFIDQLPRGEIVAGVAIDDVSAQLQPSAVRALESVGVENDLRFQFRLGHAFIGVKGALPGQALERVDGRFPANVAVGKDVASDRVAFALGGIRIDR